MTNFIITLVMGVTVSGCIVNDYIMAPEASENNTMPPLKEWVKKIELLAPDKATVVPVTARKVLVFSLTTGFKHKVAPHVKEVIRVLGQKSGAFCAEFNDDISVFEKENLQRYDAVLLNNVCPKGPQRDLFLDVLGNDQQTARLEGNLLAYVKGGGGLVVVHGAIAFQINSLAMSDMVGGSFNFHPKRQIVTLDLVDPSHPLVAAFEGKGFIHEDEPYIFKNAYTKKDFRPLLKMDISKLDEMTRTNKRVKGDERYVAWIKRHGEGRVFYCSPSHQPESYETKEMLRFLLDGIQYALGDLTCDDTPIHQDK